MHFMVLTQTNHLHILFTFHYLFLNIPVDSILLICIAIYCEKFPADHNDDSN